MEQDMDVRCQLLFTLARSYGWSERVEIESLVDSSSVSDEQRAEQISREILPKLTYVEYDKKRDTLELGDPPFDEMAEDLYACGCSEMRIKSIFGNKQDAV